MKTKWQAWLAGALFVVALPASALAQQAQSPDSAPQPAARASETPAPGAARTARGTHSAWKQLNLTPEQRKQVKAIHEQRRSQLEELRNDTSLTDEQREQQTRQIRRDSRRQMLALLTPEQRANLREIVRERRMNRQSQAPAASPLPATAAPENNPPSPE